MSEALTAISAVSLSLISPTIKISGSCLNNALKIVAKPKPISFLHWTWFIPSIWYSIGSSTVEILTSSLFLYFKMLYSVLDFPEPVGPLTKIIPVFWFIAL